MFEPGQVKRQKPPVMTVKHLLQTHPYWISLAAGAVSATGFAPLGLWPLTLVALAIWMMVIDQQATRKSAFLAGWLFGLGHFVIGLNWIAKAFTFQAAMPEWLGYIAVVLLSLYLAVYPALTAVAAWMIGKGRPLGLVLAFAAFWIVTEWLRSWVFSGFIWNPLGSILTTPAYGTDAGQLVYGMIAGASRVVGTYGLSAFVIVLAGALISFASRRWKSAALLLLLGSAFWGAGLMSWQILGNIPVCKDQTSSDCGPPAITVVQPNIGQQDKWQAGYEEQNFAKLAALTERKSDKPRILFWPEAAIPDYLETGYPRRYYYGRSPVMVRAQLGSLMKPGDKLVLGALKLEFDEAGAPDERRAVGARNSVFVMDSDRELIGRYDKSHLVPYGEYLPMRPLLSAIGLSRLAPGNFDFWPGPGPRSLDLGAMGSSGLQICYEIIFSGQVVDRANRPDFIFNPSNDAWFGSWGPPQHLAQARLRAIEEGLPVIRSTPTGISAVIDADGAVRDSIAMGVAGRIDSEMPAAKAPTLFARYGNILPLGFALVLLICAIAIRQRSR